MKKDTKDALAQDEDGEEAAREDEDCSRIKQVVCTTGTTHADKSDNRRQTQALGSNMFLLFSREQGVGLEKEVTLGKQEDIILDM